MASTTRGPLPSGVYWRRRLAVLSLALVVFLGVGRLLGDGSDGSSDDSAEQAGATTTSSAPTLEPSATSTKDGKGNKGKKGKGKNKNKGNSATPTPTPTPSAPPLPDPTGPCQDADVFITASVAAPIAGSDITIMLNFQSAVSEACTWQLSPETLAMHITSGHDKIWRSEDCPDAIASQDVVVRRASVSQVPVLWNSKRSDEECSDRTAWALPGFYHIKTAPLGGEKTDMQFELVAPVAQTVTQTAEPKNDGKGKNGGGGGQGR